MPIDPQRLKTRPIEAQSLKTRLQRGVTLVETVVFIAVVALALTALLRVFQQHMVRSVDPVVQVKALEKAQSLMDEILARRFDAQTPTGGVPACDTASGPVCAGINPDTRLTSVGDYHLYRDESEPGFPVQVQVVAAGADLGLPEQQARRVQVQVGMPGGSTLTLSAYKVNF